MKLKRNPGNQIQKFECEYYNIEQGHSCMFTDITTIADVDQCTCSQKLLSVITDGQCSCRDPYIIEMNNYLSRELSHYEIHVKQSE